MNLTLQDLLMQRAEVLTEIGSMTAAGSGGNIGAHYAGNYEATRAKLAGLDNEIAAKRSLTTVRSPMDAFQATTQSRLRAEGGGERTWGDSGIGSPPRGFEMETATRFSAEYAKDFFSYVASKGTSVGAALYEGSDGAGGYAVPSVVSDQIVPLAPNEMAVRQLAQVIPTTSDVRIPQIASFGATNAKAENAAFTENDLALSQFTLSAFMAGNINTLSWELAQDVPLFQSVVIGDLILAQQMYEENLYVNGTGTGQAQGLVGNVGAGVTLDPDASGNLIGIPGILDLIASLKGTYHLNASFLMTRATGVVIRKAQALANLFEPAWTRIGRQDFLFGYPVYFSTSMPAAARGAKPILFGDFKAGYIIGDRGGSGINVKVLDQPLASQGQLQLLTYRRTDGRVRRSEAIQSYGITASGTSAPE